MNIQEVGVEIKLFCDSETGTLYLAKDGEFVEIFAQKGERGARGAKGAKGDTGELANLSGFDGEIAIIKDGNLTGSGFKICNENLDFKERKVGVIPTYNVLRSMLIKLEKLIKKGE